MRVIGATPRVASRHVPRSPLPAPMCGLWRLCRHPLRSLPSAAPPAHRPELRALRRSDGLAGGALQRVLRPAARVRFGPSGGCLRPAGGEAGGSLEGAGPPYGRQLRGRPRWERDCEAGSGCALLRSCGWRAGPETRPPSGWTTGRRAGAALGPACAAGAQAVGNATKAAGTPSGGAAPQRARRVSACSRCSLESRPRGRRLHERRHCDRRRVGGTQGWSAPDRGRYLRTGRALDSPLRPRTGGTRCSCR